MKILVLNCGSSSLKYQFIDMATETALASGLCERIGTAGALIKHEGKDVLKAEKPMKDHKEAIGHVIDALLSPEHGVIADIKEVQAVGHRVVHGGETFTTSAVITDEVYAGIQGCCELAPLHNPANLMGIDACKALLPGVAQVAVFDTAFHQTMPEHAFLYAIPYEYYQKHAIRRYGFHGTSHKYVANRVAELMGKPIEELKIITAHMGNGASVAAINAGKVVDTSMGFTPLEGLIMGTRSGDLDPAVVTFLEEKEGLTTEQVSDILNKKSGVLGLSNGLSNDFRDLETGAAEGNKHAAMALTAFHYRVAKYIGSYVAALNGVDAIVFTAGLGENSGASRAEICSYLGYLGIEINPETNNTRGKELQISKGDKPAVWTVPTNEELVIARDTLALCK